MGKANADVLIAVGGRRSDWEHIYTDVDSVASIGGTYAMSWRLNMPIFVARHPRIPFDSVWVTIKHYI
jgi:hypothetical protein